MDKATEERQRDWQLGRRVGGADDTLVTSSRACKLFGVESRGVEAELDMPRLESGQVALEQAIRSGFGVVVSAPLDEGGGGDGEG